MSTACSCQLEARPTSCTCSRGGTTANSERTRRELAPVSTQASCRLCRHSRSRRCPPPMVRRRLRVVARRDLVPVRRRRRWLPRARRLPDGLATRPSESPIPMNAPSSTTKERPRVLAGVRAPTASTAAAPRRARRHPDRLARCDPRPTDQELIFGARTRGCAVLCATHCIQLVLHLLHAPFSKCAAS